MFTTKAGETPHTHKVELDGQGTGQTIDTSDGPLHTHKIENYVVAEANLAKDGHTHDVDVDGVKVWRNGDTPKVSSDDDKSIKDKLEDIKESGNRIKIEVEVCLDGQQPVSVPTKQEAKRKNVGTLH